MAQRDLAFVCQNRRVEWRLEDGENGRIERGDFSLLESNANEKAHNALADGPHVVQSCGVEVFVVSKEVANGFVFGVEVALGNDLAVLFDKHGMQETGCGVGRVREFAQMDGEWGCVRGGRVADGLCAESECGEEG